MQNQYLTPAELIEKYPAVMEKFHWSPRELGLFLKCKILEGHYDRRKRSALIKESSLLQLVKYANQVIEEQKITLLP
jgi:hypothetical protein